MLVDLVSITALCVASASVLFLRHWRRRREDEFRVAYARAAMLAALMIVMEVVPASDGQPEETLRQPIPVPFRKVQTLIDKLAAGPLPDPQAIRHTRSGFWLS